MFLHRNVKKYIYIASMYIFPVLFCFFFLSYYFPLVGFPLLFLLLALYSCERFLGKTSFFSTARKHHFLYGRSVEDLSSCCLPGMVSVEVTLYVFIPRWRSIPLPPPPPPPKKIYIYNKIQISSTYNIICL